MDNLENANEDYLKYVDFSITYQAQKETMEEALLYFRYAVIRSCEDFADDEDLYKIYNALAVEFDKAYEKVVSDSDTLKRYYEYEKLMAAQEFFDNTEKVFGKFVVSTVVSAICPYVGAAWGIADVGSSVIQFVWEKMGIDDMAEFRDICLNLILFYDAAGNAMSNEFKNNLEDNKDIASLCVFETGMEMYNKIHSLTVQCLKKYTLSMAAYAQNTYTSIEGNFFVKYLEGNFSLISSGLNYMVLKSFSKDLVDICNYLSIMEKQTNAVQCCDKISENIMPVSIFESEKYNIAIVACPVDITVLNGTETAAKIENDKLVATDKTCNIEIIFEEENKSAAKVITYPADYELKITGCDTGTMSISKITVINGEISDSYIAENIPVEQGYSYCETRENDVTKIGIDYDSDENYDEYIDLQTEEYTLGDVIADGKIDANDASAILREYAAVSTNLESLFNENQKKAADVNFDKKTDASDASDVLKYYVYISTSSGEIKTPEEFF